MERYHKVDREQTLIDLDKNKHEHVSKREQARDKDLSRGSARHKGLLTSTLLRKPQRLGTTKVNSSLTPITLDNRWRLSTRITKGNTNTLELPQIGLESFQEPLSV
jgi:hypothetical protein